MISKEERKHLAILKDDTASAQQHKAALQWLGDYLEEGYILNLLPSPETLEVLQKFGRSTKAEAALKKRAAALHKKYRPKR